MHRLKVYAPLERNEIMQQVLEEMIAKKVFYNHITLQT